MTPSTMHRRPPPRPSRESELHEDLHEPAPGHDEEPRTGPRLWKLVVIIVAVIGLLVGGFFLTVMWTLKSSEIHDLALAKVRADPAAVTAFGTPISANFLISGRLSTRNDSGSAELRIPISGPKSTGLIYVHGVKGFGLWGISQLQVRVDATGQVLSIVGQRRPRTGPPSPKR